MGILRRIVFFHAAAGFARAMRATFALAMLLTFSAAAAIAQSAATTTSKYPPAEPVALRLLAPQRGLTATVRSKNKNKSKSHALLSSLP